MKRSARRLDITGQRFGRLIAIKFVGADKHNGAIWSLRCDCGKRTKVRLNALRVGHTISCGCAVIESATKHGKYRTPAYNSWQQMRDRCLNRNSPNFARWGGAGVVICERWDSFAAFLADMGERPKGTSLDRFPKRDGNYEPGNCRWATPREQARNRSSTKITIEIARGIFRAVREEKNMSAIARRFGVSPAMVYDIRDGRSWRDASGG